MSLRLCCCIPDLPCQPCAEPVSPCTQQKHRIEVACQEMFGVSAGDGCLTFNGAPENVMACMRGACTPKRYKRKKVYWPDYYTSTCNSDQDAKDEACSAMSSAPEGPAISGTHIVEWSGCEELVIGENDYYEEQSDCAYITGMYVDQQAKCLDGTVIQSGCFTLVDVEYTYDDNFNVKRWRGPDCDKDTVNEAFTQVWRCRYARKVAANQKVAVGNYSLISIQVTLFPTIGPSGLCESYRNLCSTSWTASPLSSDLPWQPPPTIKVSRLC